MPAANVQRDQMAPFRGRGHVPLAKTSSDIAVFLQNAGSAVQLRGRVPV